MKKVILISFPRSGAHWLRTVLALHDRRFTAELIHTHDNHLELSLTKPEPCRYRHETDQRAAEAAVNRKQINVYLYREPWEVLFSMSEYYRPMHATPDGHRVVLLHRHWQDEPLETMPKVRFWLDRWKRNVRKWTSGPEAGAISVFIRYPDISRGARHILNAAGLQPEERFLGLSRDEVRDFILGELPPGGDFDRLRILETQDDAWEERRNAFRRWWRRELSSKVDLDMTSLPQT